MIQRDNAAERLKRVLTLISRSALITGQVLLLKNFCGYASCLHWPFGKEAKENVSFFHGGIVSSSLAGHCFLLGLGQLALGDFLQLDVVGIGTL